jgi:hypothetical protein
MRSDDVVDTRTILIKISRLRVLTHVEFRRVTAWGLQLGPRVEDGFVWRSRGVRAQRRSLALVAEEVDAVARRTDAELGGLQQRVLERAQAVLLPA